MRVHLTLKSSNSKTGPIPVSTTEKASCPDRCSLKGNGCYASDYHLNMHWEKVSQGLRGTDWQGFVTQVSKFKPGQLWRHNQAGDLPSNNGKTIDWAKLDDLIQANQGKRGFTYTHYSWEGFNGSLIKQSNARGFTINTSTESLDDALASFQAGFPTTVILNPGTIAPGTQSFKYQGATISICPAQTREGITCASCALCSHANRGSIVGFLAHGASKNKVIKILKL
jgi:hypothetical protein